VLILCANAGMFIFLTLLEQLFPRMAEVIEPALWNTPRLVRQELHLWQPLTANFVHSGIVHLSVNLLFIIWFGSRLEKFLGGRRFVLFYLLTGVFANLVYDIGARFFESGATSGGASGCVLGIMVLHALCFPNYELHLYGVFPVRFWWIAALFVLSDVSSFFPPGGIPWINSIVHLGGAAFGAIYWLAVIRPGCPTGGVSCSQRR
jgi:membrane associated rhomboid family serine protease